MILSQVKTRRFCVVWILCSLIALYALEIRPILFGNTQLMSAFDATRLNLFWHVSVACLIGLVLALVTLLAIETKRFRAVWLFCSLITFCFLLFSYHIYGSFPVACFVACSLGNWYELEIRRVLFGETPLFSTSDHTLLILFKHVSASCLIGLVLALVTLKAIKPADKEKE